MDNQNRLWTIASTMVTHTHESTFGGGRNSESASLHRLSWDPLTEAFIRGDKGEFLMGHWSLQRYPCDPGLAEAILTLCASEEVQRIFFENMYAQGNYSELYMCSDHMVALHRYGTLDGTYGYTALTSFSFEFYAPDGKRQSVHLLPDLSRAFAAKIKGLKQETIAEQINRTTEVKVSQT